MSLGDYLRLLRAKHGGLTPWDIESATTLPKGLYRQTGAALSGHRRRRID